MTKVKLMDIAPDELSFIDQDVNFMYPHDSTIDLSKIITTSKITEENGIPVSSDASKSVHKLYNALLADGFNEEEMLLAGADPDVFENTPTRRLHNPETLIQALSSEDVHLPHQMSSAKNNLPDGEFTNGTLAAPVVDLTFNHSQLSYASKDMFNTFQKHIPEGGFKKDELSVVMARPSELKTLPEQNTFSNVARVFNEFESKISQLIKSGRASADLKDLAEQMSDASNIPTNFEKSHDGGISIVNSQSKEDTPSFIGGFTRRHGRSLFDRLTGEDITGQMLDAPSTFKIKNSGVSGEFATEASRKQFFDYKNKEDTPVLLVDGSNGHRKKLFDYLNEKDIEPEHRLSTSLLSTKHMPPVNTARSGTHYMPGEVNIITGNTDVTSISNIISGTKYIKHDEVMQYPFKRKRSDRPVVVSAKDQAKKKARQKLAAKSKRNNR